MKYKVTLTYQYTHTVEVEAESAGDAVNLAVNEVDDSNRNYDDSWYDALAVECDQ